MDVLTAARSALGRYHQWPPSAMTAASAVLIIISQVTEMSRSPSWYHWLLIVPAGALIGIVLFMPATVVTTSGIRRPMGGPRSIPWTDVTPVLSPGSGNEYVSVKLANGRRETLGGMGKAHLPGMIALAERCGIAVGD